FGESLQTNLAGLLARSDLLPDGPPARLDPWRGRPSVGGTGHRAGSGTAERILRSRLRPAHGPERIARCPLAARRGTRTVRCLGGCVEIAPRGSCVWPARVHGHADYPASNAQHAALAVRPVCEPERCVGGVGHRGRPGTFDREMARAICTIETAHAFLTPFLAGQ